MGRPVVDITGRKYEKLTVMYLCDYDNYDSKGRIEKVWHCKCDCGNEIDVIGNDLKSGWVKSCGCLKKQKDITGKTFGDLTVISTYKRKDKTRCVCKCSCGNEYDADYYNLVNNKITHCGCKRRKDRPERIKDLTGMRVGMLTVIKRDKNEYFTSGGKKLIKWICKCDCGNVKSIDRGSLRSGRLKSCGCLLAKKQNKTYEEYKKAYANIFGNSGQAKDISGNKFGKLKAIHRVTTPGKRSKWLCECDCGGKIEVQTSNLINGHTQSCGCINSVGETKISMFLNDLHINYQREYVFKDCKDERRLPFDFAILNGEDVIGLIEYDGKQHFQVSRFNGMTQEKAISAFETCKKHDRIKDEYCKKNKIPLLRIKYTQYDDVKKLVYDFLKMIQCETGELCA